MKQERLEDEIEKALSKEIEFQLPDHFTDHVMQQLQERQTVTDHNLPWVLLISGLFLVLCGIVTVALYTELLQPERFLSSATWITTITLSIGIIQYLDKKLVKDKIRMNQIA